MSGFWDVFVGFGLLDIVESELMGEEFFGSGAFLKGTFFNGWSVWEGGVEVMTAHVFEADIQFAWEGVIEASVGEAVLNFVAREAVILVFDAVLLDFEAAGFNGFVRALIDRDEVITAIELIAHEVVLVGIGVVVVGDVLDVPIKFDGVLFAWREHLGLAEGAEDSLSLFDFTIDIWGVPVELDNVFASDSAGVLDFDGDVHLLLLAGEDGIGIEVSLNDLLGEGGIA